MKLAVIGSRDFQLKNRLYFELDELRKKIKIDEIVSGGARGADRFAKEYAEDRKIKYKEFPADWTDMSEPCIKKKGTNGEYNALAGFKRNKEIAKYSDKYLAFLVNNSSGTSDCIKQFKELNKSGKEIKF